MARKSVAVLLALLVVWQPMAEAAAAPLRPAAPSVIHLVQDIHAHAEAQRDIAATLRRLRDASKGRLKVGVEGAAGPFDFSRYRAFPGENIRAAVAAELLDEDKIAGPVYAALLDGSIDLEGVETPEPYIANVDAYRRGSLRQKEALEAHRAAVRSLAARKSATFSPELARFDESVSSYRAGRLPLGAYLESLAAIDEPGLAVEAFLAAHRMERDLDFAAVEREKRRFVERLVRAFDAADVERVRRWAADASSEGSGAGARFEFLFHAARSKGVSPDAFPALTDYVRYLRLADAVDADRLLAEAAKLERLVYARLCDGIAGAADLVAADRRLHLTGKLIRFELTRDEWAEYRSARAAGAASSAVDLAPFEEFYAAAERRDSELAAHVRRSGVSAVVAGGFHTAGLARALQAAGVSVDIVRPRISAAGADEPTAYLSGFAARKTPLERLFSRWTLFLSLPHVIGVERPLVPSINDDAPARFVEKFRRHAAAEGADMRAVDVAADALERPGAPRGVRGLLSGAIGAWRGRSPDWLVETIVYLSPLAVGLAVGNPWLAAAGALIQALALPAAHARVDGPLFRQRFAARSVWSAVFLGVYGAAFAGLTSVGVPAAVAAPLALVAPAWTHRLNHRAARDAGSTAATILTGWLRLPRLAMSTGGQGEDEARRRILAEVMDEAKSALEAWRAQKNYLSDDRQGDPVLDFYTRLHARAEESGNAGAMAAMAEGVTRAYFEASFKPAELSVRARRDLMWVMMRGVDLTTDLAGRINERLLPGVYSQLAMMFLAVRPDVVASVRSATENAITESSRRLILSAVEAWRANRRNGGAADADQPVRRAWAYLRRQMSGASGIHQPLFVQGATSALSTASLTPEELAGRLETDMRDELGLRFDLAAQAYTALAADLRSKRRTQQAEAIDAGLQARARFRISSDVAVAIRDWLDSNSDPAKRSHDGIVKAVDELLRNEPTAAAQRLVMDGFVTAYEALANSPPDLRERVAKDVLFAGAGWMASGYKSHAPLRNIVAVHRRVAAGAPAEAAAAVEAGLRDGWSQLVRSQAREILARERDGRPLPGANLADLPGVLSGFARQNGFSEAQIAEAFVEGLSDAKVTDDEAATWIRVALADAMTAQLDDNGRSRLAVAHDIARRLGGKMGPGRWRSTKTADALDAVLNVPDFVRGQMVVWRKSTAPGQAQTAGLEISAAMMRLAGADYLNNSDGRVLKQVEDVLFDAALSPEHLQLRVTQDVSVALQRFATRPLLPEMLYWDNKVMDPDLRAMVTIYTNLAERFVAAGQFERAGAVHSALVEMCRTAAGAHLDEVHARSFILFANVVAYACMRDDHFDLAIAAAGAMTVLVRPSLEMPEVMGWISDIFGEANRQMGQPGPALRHGFENTTLVAWRDVATDLHSDAQAAKVVHRMYVTGRLLFQSGTHGAGRIYLRRARELLEARPKVRAIVGDITADKIRGLEAACNVILDRDDDALNANLRVVKETIERISALPPGPDDDRDEIGFLLGVLIEMDIEMCRTGDERFLAAAMQLGDSLYRGDAYRQLRAFNLAKAVRLVAQVNPEARPRLEEVLRQAYAAQDPRTMDLVSAYDAVYVDHFALAEASFGRHESAVSILKDSIEKMGSPAFVDGVGPETADRMRAIAKLELAAVMSAMGAEPATLAPLIAEGLAPEVGDERAITSTQRLFEKNFIDAPRILAACGLVVTAPDKNGWSQASRVNAAILARTLDPAGFPALLDTWGKKSGRIKAVRERLALMDEAETAPWPGVAFAKIRHEGEMAFHERFFQESLILFGGRTGVDTFHDWVDAWDAARREMWMYAASLARLGAVEESVAVLKAARRMMSDALKKFTTGKKLAGFDEDPGLLAFPYVAGNDRALMREAAPIFNSNDSQKIRFFSSLMLMSAGRIGEADDWKSEKDYTSALESADRLVDKITDPAYRPGVEFVHARIARFAGRIQKAREALGRALATASDDPDAVEGRTRARVEMAKFSLWDSSLPIDRRLSESARLLAEARNQPGYDRIQAGYQELALAMFQFDPLDPAACARLADQVLALLDAAVANREMKFGMNLGIPVRMAELSLLLLPDAAARVADRLAGLAEQSGGRGGNLISFGLALRERFAADPLGFIAWTDDAALPELPRVEVNVWRLAAAHRTGDRALVLAELQRLVTDRRAFYPDGFSQSYLLEQLMESRLLRDSYLGAARAVLENFNAAEWKGQQDALRRALDIACALGDPQLIYLLDALNENKEFPLRSALTGGQDPLLPRLETLLTTEQWAERIVRMDALNEQRSASLREQALRRLGADAATELDRLIADQRFGPVARERIRTAMADARERMARREFDEAVNVLRALPSVLMNADVTGLMQEIDRAAGEWELEKQRSAEAFHQAEAAYNRLDFAEAAARLGSMHRDLRTDDSYDLARRNAAMIVVWGIYQEGDLEGALRRLSSAPASSDPVPTSLRRRIEKVLQGQRLLDQRRPQSAQVILDAMNGGAVVDPMHVTVRRQVSETIDRAEKAFHGMRESASHASHDPAAIERIRLAARATFAIDSEYETAMQALIEKAQWFYDRKDYRTAQALLQIVLTETTIFDVAAENYSRFQGIRRQLEKLRSLARAHEMSDWLRRVARLLRLKLEAEMHAEARSVWPGVDADTSLRGQTFAFPHGWKIDKHGNLVIEKLALLQREDGSAARPSDTDLVRRPVAIGSAPFQPNMGFQVSFGSGDNVVRIPVSFVRRMVTGDPRLIFLPDATGLEILRKMEGRRVEGRLTFMPDISTLVQVSALNITLDYVDRHIAALSNDRAPVHSMPVISRLLGLDLSPQSSSEPAFEPSLSARFEDDPSQSAAIVQAVQPGTVASALQGPPGTGKTTTGAEVIRHLVRPRSGEKGRIVVVTAQAHAGIDNMTLRLQRENVAVIRVASEAAQSRVARKLQMSEREQIERLLDLLETHQATGVGFAYCVTNNGLRGARRCFDLLTLYLSGESMNEIRFRAAYYLREPGARPVDRTRVARPDGDGRRPAIRPVWAQEEAGQANVAETIAVPVAINADKAVIFGDQDQLSPGRFDERSKRLIQQEARAGMTVPSGPLHRVLSREALSVFETSLFEAAYRYAQDWSRLAGNDGGAGLLTGFLDISRRSHWLIVSAIVNVYYGDRLHHREERLPRNRWEKVRKDTVVFVNSDGSEESDDRERETDISEREEFGRGDSETTKSKRNFREVGEVVRAVTYHINSRSALDQSRRRPGDILVLTPYKAQNRLINETLRWVAIANDYARRESVSGEEIDLMKQIVTAHAVANRASRVNIGEVRRLLDAMRRTAPGRRAELVELIFATVAPMYELRFDAERRIGRHDLPEIEVEAAPPATPAEETAESVVEAAEEEESLDEMQADVVEAKTVHRIQGQERKVVIVSLVRSDRLGFLDGRQGRRIINVATSRAEENLVVIFSRDRRPSEVVEMERRLKSLAPGFQVLDRFPSSMSELASLRRAWGLSTGSVRADHFIDAWVGPALESAAFLAAFGAGLLCADPFTIAVGIAVKLGLFPLLHALPRWLGVRSAGVDVGKVAGLSAVALVLYTAAFAVSSIAGFSPSAALWASMILPVVHHIAHNRRALAALTPAEIGETGSLELDSLDGIASERASRAVDHLSPPVRRAPVFNYGSARPVRSRA